MVENPLLKEFGLQTGDNILAINDNEIVNYSDLKKYFLEAQVITIERNGSKQKINLPEDFLGRLSSSKSRGFFELRTPFIISRVVDSSLNKKVDLKKGDLILSINGKELKYFDQLEESLTGLQDQTIEVELLRKGNKITRNLNVDKNGKLGIFNGGNLSDIESLGYFDIIEKQYTFGESIGVGLSRFKNQIGSYWMQLKLIFTPSTGAYKGVGGFKAIFDIFPDTWSWESFWNITAFLSIMLGVLNLLPIPALDGGHVMFLLYEMVSGRKPSDKFMEYAQMIGFFILIALVLFANGNDIFKAIFN
jgi:regulator of sigma E protease